MQEAVIEPDGLDGDLLEMDLADVQFAALWPIGRTSLTVIFPPINSIFAFALTCNLHPRDLFVLIVQLPLEMSDFLDPLLDLLVVGFLPSPHQVVNIEVYVLLAKRFLGLASFLGSIGLPLLIIFDDLKVHMGPVDDGLEGIYGLCCEIDLAPLLDHPFTRIVCQIVHLLL